MNKLLTVLAIGLSIAIIWFSILIVSVNNYLSSLPRYYDYQIDRTGDSINTYNFNRLVGSTALGHHGIDSVIRADTAANNE